MPQISSYPLRPLARLLGVDAAGRVGTTPPAGLVNVVMGATLPDNNLPISASKTRFMGRRRYRFGRVGPTEARFTFNNFHITGSTAAPETPGPNDVTITKAAAVCNGVVVPVTVKGQRSFTIPAGQTEFMCDPLFPSDFGFSSLAFPPNTDIEYRHAYDLSGTLRAPSHAGTFRPGWSQSWRGLPSDLTDQVDATGLMTVTGTPDAINIWFPSYVSGRFATPFASIVQFGDSIFTRQNDLGALGDMGGGYNRRAAYLAGIPCTTISVGGRTAAHFVISPKCRELMKSGRFTDAHLALGTNDINFAQSKDTMVSNLRTLWTDLRAGGVRTIVQSTIPPRTLDNSFKVTDLTQMAAFATTAISAVNGVPAKVAAQAVAISQASPAAVTLAGHGLVVGQTVAFRTDGSLPAGLSVDTAYYVSAVVDANTFNVAANQNYTPSVATTSTGSGNHSMTVEGYGFGPGETRDQFNAALAGEVTAGNIDAVFDLAGYCQDAATTWKWKVAPFSTTLSSAVAIGATSLSLAASPNLYDSLVLEPGSAANVDLGGQGGPWPFAVSGSGPYTATLTYADPFNPLVYGVTPAKAHASGAVVKATFGTDGTHPATPVHTAAAADLKTLYRNLVR